MEPNHTTRSLVLMTRPPGVEQGRAEPLIVWMSSGVAARLRALGLEQPVELGALPGKWWSILADLAALGTVSEPGCGFGQTMASTESIVSHYTMYWGEIVAGPFDRAEDAEAVYLAGQGVDVAWLGSGVTVARVSPSVSRRMSECGFAEPVRLSRLAGKYWACGMGGGWCSTAELEDRIRRVPASVNITHGPFDREVDAQYSFDRIWEPPE
jgi:hypothetical protein